MSRQQCHHAAFLPFAGPLLLFFVALVTSRAPALFADDQNVPPAPTEEQVRILKDFFRDVLVPKGNPGRIPQKKRLFPDRQPNTESEDAGHDAIDSRAPHDAKIEQLLQAAELSVKQKNWKLAIELFQRLLDQPEDSLHRSAKGPWQSVRRTTNQMLGQLPEATLVEYRSQYGGLAQQQLAAARRSGQTSGFVNVATRFFHTPAGYEAANYLGMLHFDRSEFGLAARWFEELAASPAPIAKSDSWRLQAALSFARSGDFTAASAILSRLSNGPNTLVGVGTGSVKASEWLKQAQVETASHAVALADWTQLYGTAARVGTAIGGDALLSPDWFLPLTSSRLVRDSLRWLVQDLQDQQRSMILTSIPLVVDGKVIYRDLRGIRSVEIERGRPIWESVEGVSAERILGGLPSQQIDPQDAWRLRANPFQHVGEYQGSAAEFSPLTSLLFRDGVYGLISSDGKQLFVIEDHGILSRNQPGQHWGWDGNNETHDPFGLPWKTNRLVSYDLQTGRTLWNLGGNESRESFDPPLSGSYFYGTPAVDGDELFVVAGKGDDIKLWSLDRQTGLPKWSQLIAYADTKIDLDIARRWITSQVAVGDGVIICPTTVGWLVAIDRMRQSVLWAHRYAPNSGGDRTEQENGSQLLKQRDLNELWSPSAPVIVGNYVVYTPQEHPVLVCLSAVDGRRIWEQPKDQGLYLAGVFDQKVLIVGETNVTALNLSDGLTVWSAPLDEGIRPSGRGVVVDDRFYLPLSNGELRSIELATGKRLSQTFVASRQPSLGNLAMHHGKLVSLGPAGLTVYRQRDALLAEIQKRLTADPDDATALLRSSEIQLLNHEYSDALSLLRRIATDRLLPEERSRHHSALVECLSTVIENDLLHSSTELEELRKLAESPAEKLLYWELTAEKLLGEQKPIEAFDVICKLAEESGDTEINRSDDRRITAKRTVWLSGRMLDLWSATPEAKRQVIDDRIARITSEASQLSLKDCQRIVTLFSFHPAAISARQRLVEWLAEAKDFAGARIILQQLVDSSSQTVASQAIERLARLMIQIQRPADAVYYYGLLKSKYSDVMVRDGLTGSGLADAARANNKLIFEPQTHVVRWPETPLRPVHSVVNHLQPPQNVILDTPLPYFDQISIDAYQNEQRLVLESSATGAVEWLVPLRAAGRGFDEGQMTCRQIGHQMFFVNRGILHAISPVDKQVLWTKSLGDQSDGIASGRHSNRMPVRSMTAPGQNDGAQSLFLQKAQLTGSLAIVQPNYLCVYGRRSISILDPRTGEEIWELDGLPTHAVAVGNRDALYVIIPGKDEALAYRALDGKPLEIPGVTKVLNNAIMAHGSSFLLLEYAGSNPLRVIGIGRQKVLLRLHDPVTDSTKWKREFPPGTLVSPLGEDEVVALLTDGQVQRIDVATGQINALESIPGKKVERPQERFLLSDDDRIYLIVNSQDSGHQTYGENLASIRLNGTIYCWNRVGRQFAWPPLEIKHQNLVIDRFSTLPALLCVSRSWKPRGPANIGIGSLNITAVHKQTGKMLINAEIPSAYSGFHAVGINPGEPSIDLKSYNMRLRLVPADGPVAVAPNNAKPAVQAN